MEYQRGTSGINLESDHSETEALYPDSTQQKIHAARKFEVKLLNCMMANDTLDARFNSIYGQQY